MALTLERADVAKVVKQLPSTGRLTTQARFAYSVGTLN